MWKRWMPILIPCIATPSPPSLWLRENVWEAMGYPIDEHFLQFEDTRVDMADDQTGKQENEIKSTLIRRFLCGNAIMHTTNPLLPPLKSPFFQEFPPHIVERPWKHLAIKVNKFCIDDNNESFNGFIISRVYFPNREYRGSWICGSKRGERNTVDAVAQRPDAVTL